MPKNQTLSERIRSYQSYYDHRILPKLPVIVAINGRSFGKTTAMLEKPFSRDFANIMSKLLILLMSEISGAVFSYSFNDEIILILRNDSNIDTEPYCNNIIQTISSITSSISSVELYKFSKELNMEFIGAPIFTSSVYAVPNISEVVNTLISKQQEAFHKSITLACFYELLKKYSLEDVKRLLNDKTSQEKTTLLYNELKIDYNNYPVAFKRGFACYRAAKIVRIGGSDVFKNKLIVDMSLPIFSQDQEFLKNILNGKQ